MSFGSLNPNTIRRTALLSTLIANMVHGSPMELSHQALHRRSGLTYSGCFSSSDPLQQVNTYQYQTQSYCLNNFCSGSNSPVMGLSDGGQCWCGNELPASASLVSDSFCNIGCNGFGSDKCGGNGYWTVYLTGLGSNVPNFNAQVDSPSSSSTSTSTSPSSSPSSSDSTPTSSSTSVTPSVVTSEAPGQTIVVTLTPSSTSTPESQATSNQSHSGSTDTVGIAVGVVVGVVGLAAIVAAVYFFLRHRRNHQADEEYKRHQIGEFFAPTRERKPPSTSYSHMSDSRLEPEGAHRNSVGSLADSQDYSRRILRVANPDSS